VFGAGRATAQRMCEDLGVAFDRVAGPKIGRGSR
jgi:hypothetical protein